MVGAAAVDHDASAQRGDRDVHGEEAGRHRSSASCHAPRDFPRLVALWQSGLLDLDSMVTARRPLDEVNEAMDDMRAGRGVRTVLRIGVTDSTEHRPW